MVSSWFIVPAQSTLRPSGSWYSGRPAPILTASVGPSCRVCDRRTSRWTGTARNWRAPGAARFISSSRTSETALWRPGYSRLLRLREEPQQRLGVELVVNRVEEAEHRLLRVPVGLGRR